MIIRKAMERRGGGIFKGYIPEFSYTEENDAKPRLAWSLSLPKIGFGTPDKSYDY
jgi:hypothetical protein